MQLSVNGSHQIDYPTPSNVNLLLVAAMREDVVVVATGILKGVGQDRQTVEGTVLVNPFGKCDGGGRKPGRIDGHGAEGVAADVP